MNRINYAPEDLIQLKQYQREWLRGIWVRQNPGEDLVNQKLAVKILEKYGHTVEIAENGSLAVDAFKTRVLQNKPFNVILVSWSL